MLQVADKPALRLTICHSEREADILKKCGVRATRVVTDVQGIYLWDWDASEYRLDNELMQYTQIVLALPANCEQLRDDLAVRLGDERCRWVVWPDKCEGVEDAFDTLPPNEVEELIRFARPMWTDEICTLEDVPDPTAEQTFETGFRALDDLGIRLVRPAFMPVIGPYGSGKSVLLRQLAVNLWRLHGWKTLLTSFEEKIKPRYERDLRRHVLGKPMELWTREDKARADAEIQKAFRFFRRKRNTTLDAERFFDRVEYAVNVYGVDMVILDPVNELDHCVPKGESKTDYMGRFIMRCKQLADDKNLLFIVAAHPPKDGVEKRLSKTGLLTVNDGADTAHYGNKADIGWAVWRNLDGPTLLHIDKIKDHESMGEPTLVELVLDRELNKFRVTRTGYQILDHSGD